MKQLRKENYIPLILALGFSALMFLLMLIPHSQYALLSEMTILNDSSQTGSELNWSTILPAIFTLFVILVNCVVVIMAILNIFMDNLFNFHFVSKIVLICATLSVLLELAYFFTGIDSKFDDGTMVMETGNGIVVALNVFYLIGLYFTYFKFVEKPYQEVKHMAVKQAKVYQAEEKKEEQEKTQAQQVSQSLNKDMQKMILDMLAQGKITSEEADKLLNEINDR